MEHKQRTVLCAKTSALAILIFLEIFDLCHDSPLQNRKQNLNA